MIEAHIDPTDLRELERDLYALRPDVLLRNELDPLGRRIIKKVGRYPPPSGTPRTGHLGRSWYFKTFKTDLKVGNLAVYAGWVHGEEQREYHRLRGWKRIYGIMIDETSKLIDKLERKVDRLWRR